MPETLPEELAPYRDALLIQDCDLDLQAREWFPPLHPHGRRHPVEPDHRHPALQPHWDGVVPLFPCARLDLRHACMRARLAAFLRVRGRALLGQDDALYAFAFGRSQNDNRQRVLDTLAELITAAPS